MRKLVLIVLALAVLALLAMAFVGPVGGSDYWVNYWSVYAEYPPILMP